MHHTWSKLQNQDSKHQKPHCASEKNGCHEMGDAFNRSMGPVRGTEGIIDINIREPESLIEEKLAEEEAVPVDAEISAT